MKVAIIDRVYNEAWYTWFLCRELSSQEDSKVICYGPKTGGWDNLPGSTELRSLWSHRLYPFQIARAIRADKPDVVHIQFEYNMFGGIASILLFPVLLLVLKLAQVRIFLTLHSLYDRLPRRSIPVPLTPTLVALLSKLLLLLVGKFADGSIVHFDQQRGRLVGEYRFPSGKTETIPHGTEYVRNAVPRTVRPRQGVVEILYFGNVTPRKGIEDLIESLPLLRAQGHDVRLTVAGKQRPDYASYLTELNTLIVSNDLDGRVKLTGFISPDSILRLMSDADVVVFPHREVLAASGSVATAKGTARRIVITNHSFLKSQLGSFPSIVAPAYSPQGLASAIIKALDDLDIESTEWPLDAEIEKDSWNTIAKRTLEFYNRVS